MPKQIFIPSTPAIAEEWADYIKERAALLLPKKDPAKNHVFDGNGLIIKLKNITASYKKKYEALDFFSKLFSEFSRHSTMQVAVTELETVIKTYEAEKDSVTQLALADKLIDCYIMTPVKDELVSWKNELVTAYYGLEKIKNDVALTDITKLGVAVVTEEKEDDYVLLSLPSTKECKM